MSTRPADGFRLTIAEAKGFWSFLWGALKLFAVLQDYMLVSKICWSMAFSPYLGRISQLTTSLWLDTIPLVSSWGKEKHKDACKLMHIYIYILYILYIYYIYILYIIYTYTIYKLCPSHLSRCWGIQGPVRKQMLCCTPQKHRSWCLGDSIATGG